jgi:sugar phosphate isomerase/epimerase
MRVGIASSRWREIGELPFTAYLDFARQVGAEVVDISISAGWPESRPETLRFDDDAARQVRTAMARTGITIAAFGGPDDFVQTDEAAVAVHVALVKRLIDFAVEVEVPVVTLAGGRRKPGMPLEEAADLLAAGLAQVVTHAEQKGILVAVPNETPWTADLALMLRVLRNVQSPNLRVLFDTKSPLNHGHPPASVVRAIEVLAPYTALTHIGNNDGWGPTANPTPLGQGVLDLPAILRILRDARYQGACCVQIAGPDDPASYAEDVSYLRARLRR